MTTKTENKSTVSSPGQSRPARRRSLRGEKPAVTWAEFSITVAITEKPAQFMKIVVGMERTCKSDSRADIRRVQDEIYEESGSVIEARLKELKGIIVSVETKTPKRRVNI